MTAGNPISVECPLCDGCGCEKCDKTGRFDLAECPRNYIGHELTEAINYAAMAAKGHWPIVGGTLDQSAWFVNLVQRLESETNRIDAERLERRQ